MKWLRHTDDQNSRIHAYNPPPTAVPGPMLTVAWLIDATRRAAAKLLSPDRHPETMVLRRGHSYGFTLLGAEICQHPLPLEHQRKPANDLAADWNRR